MSITELTFYYRSIGWRLGLQAVTGVVSLLFVLATFYRSASLYHPQRRAILHLKSQKRKIKSKDKKEKKDSNSNSNNTEDNTPPLFDLATLKSRTVQILLLATSIAAVGLNTPMLYLVYINSCIESVFLYSIHLLFTGTTRLPRWDPWQSLSLASIAFRSSLVPRLSFLRIDGSQ